MKVSDKIRQAALEHYCNVLQLPIDVVELECVPLRRQCKLWGSTSGDKDSILIELDTTLGYKNQLLTLAHEVVHAKQIYFGELRLTGSGFYWLGKRNRSQYDNQPWEAAAYQSAPILFDSFIRSL